jgi:hypothetical protein
MAELTLRFQPPPGSGFFIGCDADNDEPRFNIAVPAPGNCVMLLGPDGKPATGLAYFAREVSAADFWALFERERSRAARHDSTNFNENLG